MIKKKEDKDIIYNINNNNKNTKNNFQINYRM